MRGKVFVFALGCAISAMAIPTAPKGTEWESEQELGLNKLPPRAWFGHFPDTESAKGILMQTSPWHRFLDSPSAPDGSVAADENAWRFKWTKCPKNRPVDFYKVDYDVADWDVVKVPCSWQAIGIRESQERFGQPIFLNQTYIWAGTLKLPAPEGLWPKVTGANVPDDWYLGPEDNPVGSYRREFEVPADWGGKDVYLQFDGVESFFYLWINGKYVGFSKNSRNPAAFNITPYLDPSRTKNILAVEVYRNSDGSYLEAQDVYRLSGICRHVRLYCAPKRSIADVKITTKPAVRDVFDGGWNVKIAAEFRYTGPIRDFDTDLAPGCTISARVFDAEGREVNVGGVTSGSTLHEDNTPYWADNNFSIVKLDLKVEKPRLWSAEAPNLYTLVLELRDWTGAFLEAVAFQLGFRAVEIRDAADPKDRVFLFNGKPIKVKGVNRGDCHPKYGHYVPDEVVLQDIKLIKQANMNHIRCSHFPQGEYFYYLCNKFGIYLMDEANLESHGYCYGDLSLSHREEWLPAHWDRVRAMYEWDKNNPSVIFWSLGNEAGPGRAFKECYENLKGRDPDGRPINWERNNSLVDIGSRQYPSVEWVRDVAAGTNTVMYPYHINEYAHDRLSCPNDIKAYQDAIESSDRIIGAAIWDWADQALLKKTKVKGEGEEKEVWLDAFGGDWNEKPVEGEGGDGILEGVVRADRTPEPSYWEAKYAYQPYCFEAVEGKGGNGDWVQVESKNFFVDSSDVRFEYRLVQDGRFVGEWQELELGSPIQPREKRVFALPAEACAARAKPGVAICFRAVQITEKNLISAGWTVAEDQVQLSDDSVQSSGACSSSSCISPSTVNGVLSVADWRFDRKTGVLLDVNMTMDAFRYPVGKELFSYVGQGPGAIYQECLREGLRNPQPTLLRFTDPVKDGDDWVFETEQIWRGAMREECGNVSKVRQQIVELGPTTETNTAFRTVNRWRVCADGSLDLDTKFIRLGRALDAPPRFDWAARPTWKTLPRLGWRFELPVTGAVEYYGTGPWETYPQRKAGAFPFVWRAKSVTDMGFLYTRNQDFGNRVDVRWVSVEDAGFTVLTRDRPFEMAVSPWTATDLITCDHPEQLPSPTRTFVTISATPSDSPALKVKLRIRKE